MWTVESGFEGILQIELNDLRITPRIGSESLDIALHCSRCFLPTNLTRVSRERSPLSTESLSSKNIKGLAISSLLRGKFWAIASLLKVKFRAIASLLRGKFWAIAHLLRVKFWAIAHLLRVKFWAIASLLRDKFWAIAQAELSLKPLSECEQKRIVTISENANANAKENANNNPKFNAKVREILICVSVGGCDTLFFSVTLYFFRP